MERRSLIISALLCGIVLSGCNKDGPVESTQVSGEFKLTWLQGLRKAPTLSLNEIATVENESFYLGDVNGSTDFYFILSNTGTVPISGITLSMVDSTFLVYPESISSLLPGTTFNLGNFHEFPIIRVTAVHGPPYRNPQFPYLMTAGLNSSSLRVAGTTVDGDNAPIDVQLIAGVTVNALLMDLKIWDGQREVDLLQSNGAVLVGGFEVTDFIQIYNVTDTVRFENTGSVPVYFKIFRNNYQDTLQIGDVFTMGIFMSSHVLFDAGETVSDLRRFPKYSNGKTYLALWW